MGNWEVDLGLGGQQPNYSQKDIDRVQKYKDKNWARDDTINEEAWNAFGQGGQQLEAASKEEDTPVQVPKNEVKLDVTPTPGAKPTEVPEEVKEETLEVDAPDEVTKGQGLLNIGGSEGMPGIFGKIQRFGKQGGLLGKAMKGMDETLTDDDVSSTIGGFADTMGDVMEGFGEKTGPQTTSSTIRSAANTAGGSYEEPRPSGAYF
tara:strand:- start:408 stop:1022 length:615 start_codon:yes stop_codon:yes gene_type:complete